MKTYPAIEFEAADGDLVYAAVDDFSPAAIEESGDRVRVFFGSNDTRDAALASLRASFTVVAVDVPDEDWAIRSQADLRPIAAGLFTVFPNPESLLAVFPNPQSRIPNHYAIVIEPSIAFGTGHHATTRLCLEALQAVGVMGALVLDVGTGSGLLAIAADRLGAAKVIGIDNDPDAIESARKNLALNAPNSHINLEVADVYLGSDPEFDNSAPNWGQTPFDVVIANLTGAMLVRIAAILDQRTKAGGTLILSGFMHDEREAVRAAYGAHEVVWEGMEDGWVALAMKKR